MFIPATILNKFIRGAWQGVIKIEEYIIVDKKILDYQSTIGPTYCLVFKDVKKNIYFKVEYTVIFKSSRFTPDNVKIKNIEVVFLEKKEITVYTPISNILKEVNNKFEELYGY